MRKTGMIAALAVVTLCLHWGNIRSSDAYAFTGEADEIIEEITVQLSAGEFSLEPARPPEGTFSEDREWVTIRILDREFGSFGSPGEPSLPGRHFLIAVPPGAEVIDVTFEYPESIEVELGNAELSPTRLRFSDQEGDDDEAVERYESTFEDAYYGGGTFGKTLFLDQCSWRRYNLVNVVYQPFTYQPGSRILTYRPRVEVRVRFRKPDPDDPVWDEIARMADDDLMDDVIGEFVINFDQALEWGKAEIRADETCLDTPDWDGRRPGSGEEDTEPLLDDSFGEDGLRRFAELGFEPRIDDGGILYFGDGGGGGQEQYDYLILVEDQGHINDILKDFAAFKAWKEKQGHKVVIVGTEALLDPSSKYYSSMGRAISIWNFLHAKYPKQEWGIKYVLLIGTHSSFAAPKIFVNSDPWWKVEMRSDHFFARLSGGKTVTDVWDKNGDGYWGDPFADGGLGLMLFDVMVGRIPFTDIDKITTILDTIIAYEKYGNSGSYPGYYPPVQCNLLAGSLSRLPDLPKYKKSTDQAYALRWIEKLAFMNKPWTISLYETKSYGKTDYYSSSLFNSYSIFSRPFDDTTKAAVAKYWNKFDPAHVVLKAHGDPTSMWGLYRAASTDANSHKMILDVKTIPTITPSHPSVVQLWGCNTLTCGFEEGGNQSYLLGTLDSKGKVRGFMFRNNTNTGMVLLERGIAAAVIGTSASTHSSYGWTDFYSFEQGSQTSSVIYNMNLIPRYFGQTTELGSAHFRAKLWIGVLTYYPSIYNQLTEPYCLQLYGDPAMMVH
jgi:Peptidase family C25/Propeptide_C25